MCSPPGTTEEAITEETEEEEQAQKDMDTMQETQGLLVGFDLTPLLYSQKQCLRRDVLGMSCPLDGQFVSWYVSKSFGVNCYHNSLPISMVTATCILKTLANLLLNMIVNINNP